MWKDIWTVAQKELRSCFTDKLILMQVLLLPFAIVFGYAMLMSGVAESTVSEAEVKEDSAYVCQVPEELKEVFDKTGYQSVGKEEIAGLKERIKAKEIDVLVVFPEDFLQGGTDLKNLSNVEVWYNSEKTSSSVAYSRTTALLSELQPKIFTVNADESVHYDFGSENAPMRKMLAMVFPMMVFMAVYTVCMNLAAESVSGDKERGFLNTMLITPVKRSAIAAGKSLYVFTAAVIASVSAYAGMAVSLPQFAKALKMEDSVSYGVGDYLQLFGITITAMFVLTAIALVISTLAKDVKQATTISPIILMVFVVGSMFTMNENAEAVIQSLGIGNDLIPAWNSMQVMQQILQMESHAADVLITCGVNIAVTLFLVWLVGFFFKREKIING